MSFLIFMMVMTLVGSAMSNVHPELEKKWRQVVRFYDVDNNGAIDYNDMNHLAAKLEENLKNLTPEKMEELKTLAKYMWDNLLHEGSGVLNEEAFVANHKNLLEKGELVDVVRHYRGEIFDVVDESDDGFIDMEEFVKVSQAIGRHDEGNQRRVFNTIDVDGSGAISREEYLNAYVQYFTNPSVKMEKLPLFGGE